MVVVRSWYLQGYFYIIQVIEYLDAFCALVSKTSHILCGQAGIAPLTSERGAKYMQSTQLWISVTRSIPLQVLQWISLIYFSTPYLQIQCPVFIPLQKKSVKQRRIIDKIEENSLEDEKRVTKPSYLLSCELILSQLCYRLTFGRLDYLWLYWFVSVPFSMLLSFDPT